VPDDKALLERYIATQEVSEARFRSLAETRAQSLRTTLLELGVPAEALSIGTTSRSEQPSVTIDLESRRESIIPTRSTPEK
jgi:hypothetical protein